MREDRIWPLSGTSALRSTSKWNTSLRSGSCSFIVCSKCGVYRRLYAALPEAGIQVLFSWDYLACVTLFEPEQHSAMFIFISAIVKLEVIFCQNILLLYFLLNMINQYWICKAKNTPNHLHYLWSCRAYNLLSFLKSGFIHVHLPDGDWANEGSLSCTSCPIPLKVIIGFVENIVWVPVVVQLDSCESTGLLSRQECSQATGCRDKLNTTSSGSAEL